MSETLEKITDGLSKVVDAVSKITDRLETVEETFIKMDKNKDGVVSLSEFKEYADKVAESQERTIATMQKNSITKDIVLVLFLLSSLVLSFIQVWSAL